MAADVESEPGAEPLAVASAAPSASAREGHWVAERPEPGLARGSYAWPGWGVALLGGTLVLLGLVYVFFRLRRAGTGHR